MDEFDETENEIIDDPVGPSRLEFGIHRASYRAAVITDESGNILGTPENPVPTEVIVEGDAAAAENPLPTEVIVNDAPAGIPNPLPVEIIIDGGRADDDRPVTTDEIIRTNDVITLIDDVRIDDAPTSFISKPFDVQEYSGAWLYISVDSTLAPTHLRILVQFSHDYDGEMGAGAATWWDFEEGFWASLGWEDTDTASGVWKTYYLPVAGQNFLRVQAVGTGTDANNYFDCTVRIRKFRGPHGVAHA